MRAPGDRPFGRRALLGAALVGAASAAAGVFSRWAQAASGGNALVELAVENGGRPFAGDHARLSTLAPSGPSERARAVVRFRLLRAAEVDLEVVAHRGAGEQGGSAQPVRAAARSSAGCACGMFQGGITQPLYAARRRLGRGRHTLSWVPGPALGPGTYVLRVSATDRLGRRVRYAEGRPGRPPKERAPIVRILGIDAAFARRSYAPGEQAILIVAADAGKLTVELLRCGAEQEPTYANNELKGVPVGEPLALDWSAHRDGPLPVPVEVGAWPSGVYSARIRSDDGRAGFAPFVLRPPTPQARVAVVLPTNTWQVYNFYDLDADGYGDSWYVSTAIRRIDLTRPHLNRGVPFRFRSYDLAFIRWLHQRGKKVDFYSDDDLESFPVGEALRAAYDLVVFPGHEEYVTAHVYDLVERYRDLGGNLLFLSANNFFRQVKRESETLEVVGLWRELGRPEAALCGTQYRASDRGTRQAPFVVTGADTAPWLFEGTGLANGSTFGKYGIEVDSTTGSSPPGTQVLARIPDLLGPGRTAEMTYYETPAGARVFSAGALNFGGQILLWPETVQLLENIWARLAPH